MAGGLKSTGAARERERRPPRYTKDLPIEGVFLHVRAIIEQGRTEDYLRACKERGYLSLRAQRGLILFTRQFIDNDAENIEPVSKAVPVVENTFVNAVRRKPKIDSC